MTGYIGSIRGQHSERKGGTKDTSVMDSTVRLPAFMNENNETEIEARRAERTRGA